MAFIRSGGFRVLLTLVLVMAFIAGAGATFVYFAWLTDLPDLRSVEDYQPALTSRVLDTNGKLIGSYANERRELAPIGSLPDHVGLAFVAAEDSHFFEHAGIDYKSIVRAALVDIKAGKIEQGASTITMQLVKQMLLSPKRHFSRKLREMVLAKQIESRFSKDEILYLYLNQIYFGGGAWGIDEAARTYFGKHAKELSVSESALLAGLPQRPSAYSPFVNPKLAERRRVYVLGRMRDEAIISATQYQTELANTPVLTSRAYTEGRIASRHFIEEVRRHLFEELGGDMVLEGGLLIETTLDVELQKAAVKSVRKGLEEHAKRRGYPGPLRQVQVMDLTTEISALAEVNKISPDEEGIVAGLEVGDAAEGIVISVQPESKIAIVSFAPGVEGQVALDDVSWARKLDVERQPKAVKQIASIFAVGDVAQFVRLEGDVLVPEEVDDETEIVEEVVEAATQLADADEAPAEIVLPDLVRLSLHVEPQVEGALLSMEVGTGEVRAMVGGYDYNRSQFNRATQALRQPGSAFKPFIYGAALSRGYTPVSILHDRPIVYEDPVSGFVWRPQNYGRHFYGPMTMRASLVRSVNNATVHLFRDVGVDYVIEYAQRLGIRSKLSRDLSLALGSSSVDLVELTAAYGVFPNKGRRVTPRFIKRVTDRDGNVLMENVILGDAAPPLPEPEESEVAAPADSLADLLGDSQVLGLEDGAAKAKPVSPNQLISEAAAYLMCDLLEAVVKDPRGTGWRLRTLGRPLAGKTGTTNDQKDAWFMGFSPGIVTGVWVGRDDSTILGWGETGSRAAAPIWVDYMKVALKGQPVLNFEEPEHIVSVRIDRASGLLADRATNSSYFQPFLEGTEPTESTTARQSTGDTKREIREDFF